MKSKIIDKVLKDMPLSAKLHVSNEMFSIHLITELGYREDKNWRDEDPEDERVMTIICREAAFHTHNQMKDINEKLREMDREIAKWKARCNQGRDETEKD